MTAGFLAVGEGRPVVAAEHTGDAPQHTVDHHDGAAWRRVYEARQNNGMRALFFRDPSRYLEDGASSCGLLEVGPGTAWRCLGGGGARRFDAHVDAQGEGMWLALDQQLFAWTGSFFAYLAEVPADADTQAFVRGSVDGEPLVTVRERLLEFTGGGFEDLTSPEWSRAGIADLCTREGQIWVLRQTGEVWTRIEGRWGRPWALPSSQVVGIACGPAGVVVADSHGAYASWRGWGALADFEAWGGALVVHDVEALGDDGAVMLLEGPSLTRGACGPLRVLVSDAAGARWL